MTAGKWIAWTTEDDEKLRTLCNSLLSPGVNGMLCVKKEAWQEITGQLTGHTILSCKHRFRILKDRQGVKKTYREREKSDNHFVRRSAATQNPVRLPEPISITAAFFGDPLPGRSALDAKLRTTHA
jgi:hypothetical protein